MIDNNYKIDLVPFNEFKRIHVGLLNDKTEYEHVIIEYNLIPIAISISNIISIETYDRLYSNGSYFTNYDNEKFVSAEDVKPLKTFMIYTSIKDICYTIYDESFTCIQDVLNYINEYIHNHLNEKSI